ncbi:MAG: RNA-binding S4 domain-containing protein [Bacteroidetes bacterium]|jgi:ribosome-associated heat shock protein Hsp15|nr:RNA-binding S4 domain-containing protein [Bacteroidota bacterium]
MSKKGRIDKWLWAVRIFKSRTLANAACKSGKVKVEGEKVKPAQSINEGQLVEVKKNGFEYTFKIIKILQKRVGAPIAVNCYENLTPEEELNKYKDWYIGKGQTEKREKGAGRPTKKDRRELEAFKRKWKR